MPQYLVGVHGQVTISSQKRVGKGTNVPVSVRRVGSDVRQVWRVE